MPSYICQVSQNVQTLRGKVVFRLLQHIAIKTILYRLNGKINGIFNEFTFHYHKRTFVHRRRYNKHSDENFMAYEN